QVSAGSCCLERSGEASAGCALRVETDWQAARGPGLRNELRRPLRAEGARRVMEQHARRAELRQPPRQVDELVGLARPPGAVHEAGVELAVGCGDRRGSLA